MQHLMTEALARLVDETPGQDEAEHLRACDACRAELEAMRRDAAALARLGPIEPEPDAWPALADRLAHEGLAGRHGRNAWRMRVLKVAAALALYAGGAATGLAVKARPAVVAAGAGQPAPTSALPRSTEPATTSAPAAAGEQGAPAAEAAGNARLAAATPAERNPSAAAEDVPATTPEQALRQLQTAERRYAQAYSRYTDLTSAQQAEPEDPVARVAALESIVLTTRAALDRAPADPVINGYHLTAVAQRDAALRQIAMRPDSRWF